MLTFHTTAIGGSISIRYGQRIYMTPSGVPKERIQPEDLFVLDSAGHVLSRPLKSPGATRQPKLSDCAPLFLHAYRHRRAGTVGQALRGWLCAALELSLLFVYLILSLSLSVFVSPPTQPPCTHTTTTTNPFLSIHLSISLLSDI